MIYVAATWIKSVGTGKKTTAKAALKRTLDYVMNREKTNDGILITGYECDTNRALDEFLLKKQLYHTITGREPPKGRDVVCYHVRQSFHPDEKLTPEQVNKLGMELAMKITGGNHQFIVCTHTDKNHCHNHIVFSAVQIDCSRKFDNQWKSSFKIRELSDEVCIGHGLSIIENPAEKENTTSRDIWEDKKKGIDWKAILETDILSALKQCKDLDSFKIFLKVLGYEVKGDKRLSIKHPDRTRFMRTDKVSNKYDYSVKGLEFALSYGDILPKAKRANLKPDKSIKDFLSLEDKSGGLEHWAKIQNIKEYIRTQNYLEKHGLTEYKNLNLAVQNKSKQVDSLRTKIKQIEVDIDKSKALKIHIINFAKTKKVYDAYQKTRYKEKFYADHSGDILLHETSKQAFKSFNLKKLPKVGDLNTQISALYKEKSDVYAEYKKLSSELGELRTVKRNVDEMERKKSLSKSFEL